MIHPLQWLFSLIFHCSKLLKPDLSDEQAAEGSFVVVNTLLLFPLIMLTDVVEYILDIDFGVGGGCHPLVCHVFRQLSLAETRYQMGADDYPLPTQARGKKPYLYAHQLSNTCSVSYGVLPLGPTTA